MRQITAEILRDAIKQADTEIHACDGIGWFDYSNLDDVRIDGKINFTRVAEILAQGQKNK